MPLYIAVAAPAQERRPEKDRGLQYAEFNSIIVSTLSLLLPFSAVVVEYLRILAALGELSHRPLPELEAEEVAQGMAADNLAVDRLLYSRAQLGVLPGPADNLAMDTPLHSRPAATAGTCRMPQRAQRLTGSKIHKLNS